MVKLVQKENKNYYQCEECQHFYESEELAKKCEEWCRKYKSCNLEIIKHAVNIQKEAELTQNLQKNNQAELTELTQNLQNNSAGSASVQRSSESENNSASSASVQRSSEYQAEFTELTQNLQNNNLGRATSQKLDKYQDVARQLLLGILIGGLIIFALTNLKLPKLTQNLQKNAELTQNLQKNYTQAPNISNNLVDDQLIQQIISQVLPPEGFKTRLFFSDTVKKMIDCGVIDLEKMKKLYNGNIPEYIQKAINGSNEPIVINQETANYLLNLFWPLGLSNKTEFNKNIPFSEKDLPYLASTGGWWLGKADNGAEYFNKCEIIKLTKEQEEIVYRVAQNTFRPCCDNSTFAQDCNHGSALLGALELAASQGYNEDELYHLALQLNSFWFPQNYIKIALYKKLIEGKDWPLAQIDNNIRAYPFNNPNISEVKEDIRVNPFNNPNISEVREIMSAKFSSISGYIQNVEKKLANIPNIPSTGGGCGL